MKKLRLCFTYWKQLGKMTTMKLNRIIPVILVIVVFVTGSLVNAYSLNTSGKLRLESKKNFLVPRAENIPGNTSDNTIFESYKGTIASSDGIRMDAYSGATITPYYFHTNGIGSTTAVTDANGNIVERYKYGLYGMPTFMDAAGNVIPKSAIGNNILFQGREYEPETNFYYYRARHLDPIMGRFLSTDPMGYWDSMNLYQGFNMNPVNFVDPFGKQHWIIEEELAGQRALKEHLIKKYGKTKGEMEFNQIMGNQRRIESAMATSFFLATGGMLIAPHLSGPALVATVGSISTYSALESYSSRKQAGQTEREASRGAFGAATGFNFLFNLMGFDYGTLEGASQEQVEDAWSTLIGGIAGGWFGKRLKAPATEIVPSTEVTEKGPATVDELIEMMNKKKGVKAEYATGEKLDYLKYSGNEGSHMYLGEGKSHILIRKDVGTRHTAFHEWLHHVIQKKFDHNIPNEDNVIEEFLKRFKNLFKLK